jgi:hypothetical protein
LAELSRGEQRRPKLRAVGGELLDHRLKRLRLGRQHQDAGWFLGQVEAVELPVVVERLQVQLRHHRVERVLDRARVAPGGRGAHLLALVQVDPRPRLRQERGGGAPDDPAADDGDVRRAAHFSLA